MAERADDSRVWRAPSIIDVAREAGVSAQTVSRVANGMDIVRPATREKVLAAMDRLGYRPNSAARALKSGRFRTLGVIMSGLSSYGNMHTLEAVANEAAKQGYSLALTPLWTIAQAGFTGAFARLADQAVDGVLVVLEAHELQDSDLAQITGIPAVVVTAGDSHPYPSIDIDQVQGARLATEHLLELGHETVWHIRGPENSYSAEDRANSWADTLRAHGRIVPPALQGDWSTASGYAAGQRLAAEPDATAVFAANDEMALGAMRALSEAGRPVPGSVSVVGFDDMDMAADFQPPLTTIHQYFDRVGTAAVGMLIDQIEKRRFTPPGLVATALVTRESTAPPAR
ncbi:DNA-binding LacI/PurR family transcriptional regulator [Microbacterium sp. W4I4]|uniref:LacI family DNA-binding transcriptional regulator n=1 Tax=Microbacterium sp. W4I4 TaxID=3042295 RepID=UPI0027842DC6|nr:LacI family DNA-binding transcriptional regulator [Microbacterium sp. W4I4]MDQ0615080.1 DNA-binding LacI/PurR family transcriptional regulator [Microbacterium sp. W4I4]